LGGGRPNPPPTPHEKVANDRVLEKVASEYAGYRDAFRALPQLLGLVVEDDPEYFEENFFGELIDDSLAKMASSPFAADLPVPMPSLYFYNAHQEVFSEPPPHWALDLNPLSPARALLRPVL